MYKKSDRAKIELVAKYISDIEKIVERHGSAEQTINDYEGEYAVMMCLTQIAEAVNKITDSVILERLDARGIISFRNRIIHNYEGRDRIIILSIVKDDIPDLKNKISQIISQFD